ncbi:hypothetical protein F5Y12DRAFT_799403 [Xylaria sp. FL1777]|nr:hypothetical protein F5Y12DRAFT_799403 [Xylaria sp. FL1777]
MSMRAPYSSGCHACRRMKVKCDGKKPQCERCTKARRVCPGYRDAKQVIFCSMNAGLASKAKTSRLSRAREPTTVAELDDAGGIASASFTPRLLTQPSEMWDTRAISHFLHNYSFPPTKDSPGYLGFLPDLLGNSSSVQYLESAVLAAGFASLANITGLTYLERTAEKHYGETLRSISSALKDPLKASSDGALAAIVVLQMYEAISGITNVSGDPHDKGLVELLRLRGNGRLSTGNGMALLQIIHSRVHVNSVGGLAPSPIDVKYDAEAVDFPAHQAELWRLMRRTSQCCVEARAMILVQGRYAFKSEIINSLDCLYSAYLCLLHWRATSPSSWSYQSCKMPTENHGSQRGGFPEEYHLFKNIQHGAMWISFWCTVIYALQMLVYASSLPVLQQTFNQGRQSSWDLKKQLRNAVDDICACVPYMMADVDQSGLPTVGKDGKALGSYHLLRGLYVASCVAELTTVQRDYMMRTFLRIAHGRGIKLALRPRNRWLNRHRDSVAQHHQI